jgi:hypothetical protein
MTTYVSLYYVLTGSGGRPVTALTGWIFGPAAAGGRAHAEVAMLAETGVDGPVTRRWPGAEITERVDAVSSPALCCSSRPDPAISSDPRLRQEANMSPKIAPVTMYDAVTPGNIPTSAEVVAGYLDGDFAWSKDDWNRFPDAQRVIITVDGSLTGNVADVENGNMTPEQAKGWIETKQREGKCGCTIYCSLATLESVWAACRGHCYYIWVADWTGSPHEVNATIATQYSNVDNAYDLTRVYSQEWLDAIHRANDPWPL